MTHPLKLASERDMFEIHAQWFVKAIQELDRMEQYSKEIDKNSVLEKRPLIKISVGILCGQLKGMGLPASLVAAERLINMLDSDTQIKAGVFHNQLRDLRSRMMDELETKFWLHLDNEEANHFAGSLEIFDQDVLNKWPNLVYEMDEACKCFAVGRYTASVFHLMRIMKTILREISVFLGANIKDRDTWLTILTKRLEPAIIALPDTTPAEKQTKQNFQQAQSHLHAVRLAWRNSTMHPKATYTREEARDLIRHVRTFLNSLVGLI